MKLPPETEEFSISGGWPELVPVEATPPDGRFFVFGGLSTVKISDKGGAALYHGRNYCFLSQGKTPTSKVGDQSNNFFSVGSNPLLR